MIFFFSRHPDKNKDPGAEDMFIKITKSYEVSKKNLIYLSILSVYVMVPRLVPPKTFKNLTIASHISIYRI